MRTVENRGGGGGRGVKILFGHNRQVGPLFWVLLYFYFQVFQRICLVVSYVIHPFPPVLNLLDQPCGWSGSGSRPRRCSSGARGRESAAARSPESQLLLAKWRCYGRAWFGNPSGRPTENFLCWTRVRWILHAKITDKILCKTYYWLTIKHIIAVSKITLL